nr:MAG TPA: hypothetical protein [Caudoviricetes sp.]
MNKIYVLINYTHDDPENPYKKVSPITAIVEDDEPEVENEFIDKIIAKAFKKLEASHLDMKLYMIDGMYLGYNVEFVK